MVVMMMVMRMRVTLIMTALTEHLARQCAKCVMFSVSFNTHLLRHSLSIAPFSRCQNEHTESYGPRAQARAGFMPLCPVSRAPPGLCFPPQSMSVL